MIERTEESQDKAGPAAAEEELSYRIELRRAGHAERVLARACSATLAHAIYKAAQIEHPDGRITLSLGETLIADSAGTMRG